MASGIDPCGPWKPKGFLGLPTSGTVIQSSDQQLALHLLCRVGEDQVAPTTDVPKEDPP